MDRKEVFNTGEIAELAEIYEGEIPAEFRQYFPRSSPIHNVNTIRLAWDDLAGSVGRIPEFVSDPMDQTSTEQKRNAKLERIAQSYLRESYPSGKKFMFSMAWWLVGTGHAVAVLVPDDKEKRPRYEVRDPRHCYPSAKRKVGNDLVELKDIIFESELQYSEAHSQGLAPPMPKKWDRGRGSAPGGLVKVFEYIDDKEWIVVSEFGMVKRTEHGMGEVPAIYATTFAPNKSGLSQFKDQITLMVAMSRIISQKIAFVDKLIYPVIWVKGHEELIKIGPNMVNKLSPQGAMGQISPPNTLQVDKDLATIERFSRKLNRNPEVRQGEVDGKGAYVGSKTLDTLNDSIDNVVARYWDDLQPKFQRLTAMAFKMDELYWPDVEKSVYGMSNGTRWFDRYVPAEDIDGRHYIRVEYGFGGGGYEDFLVTVQSNQAGLATKRQAIERMPGVFDVDAVLRGLELEAMDAAGQAAFMAAAQAGELDQLVWAKLRKQMEKKGLPLHDAILKYQKAIQEAAAAASQPDAGVSPMTAPPPEQAPQEAQMAGLPPQALAG
jgi:hypothetical protein